MGHADGFEDATDSTVNIMMLTLLDNSVIERSEAGLFMDRFKSMLATINAKNMDINDVKKILKSDYDIRIHIK